MKKKFIKIIIILFVIIVMALVLLRIITRKFSPIIMEYSKSQIKKIAAMVINKGITEDIINKIDVSKLFIIEKSNDEEIITITLDPLIVNNVSGLATDSVERSLELIEIGDSDIYNRFHISDKYFNIPTGIIFNSSILNNIGPSIPIKLKLVGNVTSGITTEVKEYGINNSLITVSMEISVSIKVILPLTSDYVNITNYVPIAIKLVQGKVPIYYGNGLVLSKEKESTQ